MLVRSVDQRRKAAAELLAAARAIPPGQAFTAAGQTLIRARTHRSAATKVWAEDPVTDDRRDLVREEDHAFWAWAAVEVLRATGIRVEELTELSHHSLVQYRLPTTGELVPLLQILPSKTDTERLLLVSPELADVLSAIIRRVRDPGTAAVPLLAAYDTCERVWSPPAPLLFQRQVGHERHAITRGSLRSMLTAALAHTGLVDPTTGELLHFTPHDFRRLFITDAILGALPPHIAQVIAGHHDINVTLGYKAVYPEEAIQAHRAFLTRRRALRPSEKYRTPTEEEWTEFLGHFEHRKVSIGTCARVRHPVHPRARLPPLPDALAGPCPTRAAGGDPQQPHRPGSPRPNARAGLERSRGCRSASPAPKTSSPSSTGAPATTPPSTWASPPSPSPACIRLPSGSHLSLTVQQPTELHTEHTAAELAPSLPRRSCRCPRN